MTTIDDKIFSANYDHHGIQSQYSLDNALSLASFESLFGTSAHSSPCFDSGISTGTGDWSNDLSDSSIYQSFSGASTTPPSSISSGTTTAAAASLLDVAPTPKASENLPTPFTLDAFTSATADLPDHQQATTCTCLEHILGALPDSHPSRSTAPTTTAISLDKLMCNNKTVLANVRSTLDCPDNPSHSTPLNMLLYHIFQLVISTYHEAWLSALAASSGTMTEGRAITFGEYAVADEDAKALVRQILLLDLRRAGEVLDRLEGVVSGNFDGGCVGGDVGVLRFLGAQVKGELERVVGRIERG